MEWTKIDGIYVPSKILEAGYAVAGEDPTREREAKLADCVLNQALDPHQFDPTALGLADGDLIIDEASGETDIVRTGGPSLKPAHFVDPECR